MRQVVLYTRPGCRLCEDVKQRLDVLGRGLGFSVVEIDIANDPALRARYDLHIPVVTVGGHEAFRHRFDGARLRELLAAR